MPKSRAADRAHVPDTVDVRAIRAGLGITQKAFADRFGFSIHTLRHWEHGLRRPEMSSRAYLLIIAYAPDVVAKALSRR